MRKSLIETRNASKMIDSIRTIRGAIEYILWYLSNTISSGVAGRDCTLNIVGYSFYSSDSYEITETYKDGNYGECVISTRSYYDWDGDFLYTKRVVKFGKYPGSAYNQYADRGVPNCSGTDFVNLSDIDAIYVGVGWGIPTGATWGNVTDYGTYYERASSTTMAATPVQCNDPIAAYGWFYTSKLVQTFRIMRDPTPGTNTMDGATYFWEATTVGNAEISATVTPNTGYYTWGIGETEKFITLTLELTGVSSMANKWANKGQRIELTLQQNGLHTDCKLNRTWYVA